VPPPMAPISTLTPLMDPVILELFVMPIRKGMTSIVA
jgi:hypothetical protein